MTVTEFTQMDNGGVMYRLVDASKRGYMTDPQSAEIYSGGDKNSAVRTRYGHMTVISFDITGKNKVTLHVRDKA